MIEFIIKYKESEMIMKLFLFDIDGTLFDNKNRKVHASTINALRKLKQTHKIGIATGRAEFMLYSINEIIDIIDYYILINGQIVKSKNQTVFLQSISANLIEPLIKDFEKMDLPYGFEGEMDEAISRIDDNVIKSFEVLALKLPPVNKKYYLEREVFQMWVFCKPNEAHKLAHKHPYFQFIRWFDYGYDVLPVTAAKSFGVKKLIEHLGISLSDVIAFGDGDNDYEMIAEAGIGIAMGNASEKVKAVADYITDAVSEDGIFNALKYYKFI